MTPPTLFITPHAVRAYRERIFQRLTPQQAEAEIRAALAQPLFQCATGDGRLALWGCVNRGGFRFLVATDPPGAGEFLLVRTVGPEWFWHEARPHWKACSRPAEGAGPPP